MTHIVMTQRTLQELLVNDWPSEDLATIPLELTDLVRVSQVGDSILFYSPGDETTAQLIVVPEFHSELVPETARASLWQRVSSLALLAQEKKLEVPRSWGQFRSKNKIALAAVPYQLANLRWSIEINPAESNDVVLWRLEVPPKLTNLEDFTPATDLWRSLRQLWIQERSSVELPRIQDGLTKASIGSSIELEQATFEGVTRGSTYSEWLPRLTDKQSEFLTTPSAPSVKLRGPAGSGKTLTLELKLLRELYLGRRAQGVEPRRYLYATHSWSMAEQVSDALRLLDESGSIDEVDVFPLLTIAETIAGTTFANFEILGEDSQSGKLQQLERIDEIVQELREGDWLVFENRVSQWIRTAMESHQGSLERNRLNWDLMLEFSTVLSASGILPGIAANERYRAVQRAAWMMPLPRDADREFVLLIYTRLVTGLSAQGKLTSDQVINDLLGYLETFAWNIRRSHDGYDQIFVDELHLFTEQERLVLHHLSRDPGAYPTIFMALDPRQSPAELYTNVDSSRISRADSSRVDSTLGTVKSVELSTVHRFSPQILELVRHLNNTYPAMDLGDDWALDLTYVGTTAASGPVPRLLKAGNVSQQQRQVQAVIKAEPTLRTAVIVADAADLYDYVGYLPLPGSLRLVVIDSRDAVENLRYAKRAVVLAAAEYVAGLQFDRVIVLLGESGSASLRGKSGHRLRRAIANLYLAITRATRSVWVGVISSDGTLPPILESAVSEKRLSLDQQQEGGNTESPRPGHRRD